jgi:hypothetical protein
MHLLPSARTAHRPCKAGSHIHRSCLASRRAFNVQRTLPPGEGSASNSISRRDELSVRAIWRSAPLRQTSTAIVAFEHASRQELKARLTPEVSGRLLAVDRGEFELYQPQVRLSVDPLASSDPRSCTARPVHSSREYLINFRSVAESNAPGRRTNLYCRLPPPAPPCWPPLEPDWPPDAPPDWLPVVLPEF